LKSGLINIGGNRINIDKTNKHQYTEQDNGYRVHFIELR